MGEPMNAPLRAGGHVDYGDGRGWVLATEDNGPEFLVPTSAYPTPVDEPNDSAGPELTDQGVSAVQDRTAGQFDEGQAAEAADGEGQGDAAISAEPEQFDEPSPAEQTGPAPKPSNAEVRAWARKQGMDVPARGPVPADLVDGYIAATAEDDQDDEEPTDG